MVSMGSQGGTGTDYNGVSVGGVRLVQEAQPKLSCTPYPRLGA